MRLYVYLAAFAAVLCSPFLIRGWLGIQQRAIERRAFEGSALELRIITPHNQDIRRVFEPAFSDWHQSRHGVPVHITYLSPGGTNDIVRYLNDLYGSYRAPDGQLLPEEQLNVGIELVWGGGDYTFERELKPFLKPLALSRSTLEAAFPTRDLAGVPLLDPAPTAAGPRWVGVVLSSFGIVHSPEFYDVLGLPPPQSWEDLARPELAGLLALADPTRSGSVAVIYMMVLQRAMADAEEQWLAEQPARAGLSRSEMEAAPGYRVALEAGWKQGMRVLLRMAANARYFTDSGSRPCADVGDAESAAGVAIDFYARVFQEQIGKRRITYHAPRGATAITPDPIGILYGTRGDQEVLANRFVEFLLSPEGQRLWNVRAGESPYVARSLRRLPVRRDVYVNRTGFADDENPFDTAEGFNMQQRWMRQLGPLIPIWAAAWIDSKLHLDRAYHAVLDVSDAARREKLLWELSDLPIEYDEVTGPPPTAAAGASDTNDPRLRQARHRLAWAERFREHYDQVFEQALEAG